LASRRDEPLRWLREFPWLLRGVLAILAAMTQIPVTHASSLTVPDDVPTVQGALDAGVDSVLLRPAYYPETARAHAPVFILGILAAGDGERPRLAALEVVPLFDYEGVLPPYGIENIAIDGRVLIHNDYVQCLFSFRHCDLLGGIKDESGYVETHIFQFEHCRIAGEAILRVDGSAILDSCTVVGSLFVGDGNASLVVSNCTFLGEGAPVAMRAAFAIWNAVIVNNLVRDYVSGIMLPYVEDRVTVSGNTLINCIADGVNVGQANVTVSGNSVRQCGLGVSVYSYEHSLVEGNLVSDCGIGIRVGVSGFTTVTRNIVWNCTGDGIVFDAVFATEALASSNTSCLNGGAGIATSGGASPKYYGIVRNVGYGNGGHGIRWAGQLATEVDCNDWFGNQLGDVDGRPPASGDFSEDPLFCDATKGDFRVRDTSPLLDRPGCGQVGALGVGCGVTATLLKRFTAERVQSGIRVLWKVAEGFTASELWLERSERGSAGGWNRPVTERSNEGGAIVELDRSAAVDRGYSYRLMAQEGRGTVVLGPPVLVEAAPKPVFALTQVSPNPARGPVQIGFSLGRAAAIEIELFDVQGRSVASLGQGLWPAGNHVVEWHGLMRGGALAPSGLYLVRYRYPGGQDMRRLVRSP
jgi:parallel beta-helix repeat protein